MLVTPLLVKLAPIYMLHQTSGMKTTKRAQCWGDVKEQTLALNDSQSMRLLSGQAWWQRANPRQLVRLVLCVVTSWSPLQGHWVRADSETEPWGVSDVSLCCPLCLLTLSVSLTSLALHPSPSLCLGPNQTPSLPCPLQPSNQTSWEQILRSRFQKLLHFG